MWPKSWIWQTLEKVMNIFCKWHFHNASKRSLLAKKFFEFHARVQKCHFGRMEKLSKWHFWTHPWNSKKFLAKSILLKHYENGDKNFFFVTCPRVWQIQGLCRKKYKKGIFSNVQWWKQISTHFSDSTHQECTIFARIGHGSCYYHWNEIFAGVSTFVF